MIPYRTKSKKISGTNYGRIMVNAFTVFDEIKKKTKRRPYIRSAYFKVEKTELFEKREILYRFAGLTAEKDLFYVQIKEDKRKKRKYFMSCFPPG